MTSGVRQVVFVVLTMPPDNTVGAADSCRVPGACFEAFPAFEHGHQLIIDGGQSVGGLLRCRRIGLVEGCIGEALAQFGLLGFQPGDFSG